MTNVVIFYPSFELKKKKVVKILAIWVKLIMIIKNEWMIIISRPNIEIFLTFFFILIKTQIYYFTYHISTYIYTGWEKIVKHLLCMQLYFLGIGKFNAFQIHVLHCFLFELHVYLHRFPRTSSIRLYA